MQPGFTHALLSPSLASLWFRKSWSPSVGTPSLEVVLGVRKWNRPSPLWSTPEARELSPFEAALSLPLELSLPLMALSCSAKPPAVDSCSSLHLGSTTSPCGWLVTATALSAVP